ncbi:MAG: hypothetical protein ACYC0X_31150 [Pirellulaceae bacterium]
MVRSIASVLIVIATSSAASAKDVVQNFSWKEMAETGKLLAGDIPPSGGEGPQDQLRIDNRASEPRTITLLVLDSPGVSTFRYAVTGSVRCENVKGRSYMEMWSQFANGGEYFSRTLGNSGPMQSLEGSSDWRSFALPFSSEKKLGFPVRVIVNLVLVDTGTVYLGPLKLIEYNNSWWSEQSGGWIGGIGGSVIGILGAMIGMLAGLGKARRFVLLLTTILALVGAVGLILGGIAFLLGQPYAVYYPLLLCGIVLAAVCGGNLPVLRRRYEEMELRKMSAMDVG